MCDEAAGFEREACPYVFVCGDFTGGAPSLHPSRYHVHVIAVTLVRHWNRLENELWVFLHRELPEGVPSDEELSTERLSRYSE